ncbi:putative protease [Dirofilaria immitis]
MKFLVTERVGQQSVNPLYDIAIQSVGESTILHKNSLKKEEFQRRRIKHRNYYWEREVNNEHEFNSQVEGKAIRFFPCEKGTLQLYTYSNDNGSFAKIS